MAKRGQNKKTDVNGLSGESREKLNAFIREEKADKRRGAEATMPKSKSGYKREKTARRGVARAFGRDESFMRYPAGEWRKIYDNNAGKEISGRTMFKRLA